MKTRTIPSSTESLRLMDGTQGAIADSHSLSVETVFARLLISSDGLTEGEAKLRLEHFGPNTLPEGKGKTPLTVFISQFKSPFIYLLLAASAVSLGLGHMADAAFILVVLLGNACIGTYQEWRAETRARGLRKLIRSTAAVRRNGQLVRLSSDLLVPGDIVQVESGERITADLRLIETRNLTVDESLLTGESVAIRKLHNAIVAADASLSDRVTMLHAGTIVQTGRAVGVAVGTGPHTAVGRLAVALERPQAQPPLVRRMARFTRHIAIATLGIIAAIAVLEIIRGAEIGHIFLIAVALAVSAIPEGLPVAMTVALSIAMHRMGLRHVIVRYLPAVEGLGACTLIATDKTGTLTLNRLSVERVWLPDGGDTTPEDPASRVLLSAAAHASETLQRTSDGIGGDAVDIAFVTAATAHGWHAPTDPTLLVERLPYEPEKRFAAAFHRCEDKVVAYVKGAPETVTAFCSGIDEEALAATRRLSADGYRVIAVAVGCVGTTGEDGLSRLRLIGLAGLIDPLRPETKTAVGAAQAAGIRVVMITGDHPLTALAIARQLGLAESSADVVIGAELAKLAGDSFDAAVRDARVFARTEPLQKLAIVESLRRQGHIIAVTGDGINDAPALHAADIGVAMGKGGTDVAREAADLILTDDNFASIIAGIEEGRVAYDNLRKVILLVVSTGAAEIFLMLLATLSGLPPPLTAVQLLWLNLITNGVQDVALAFEKGEADILKRRPRPAQAPILDRRMLEQVAIGGCVIGVTCFMTYYAALTGGATHSAAQGAVLWLLVWCENAHCFNCRSETRSVFRIPLSHNWLLVCAVVGTQALQLAVLSIPYLRKLLSLEGLTAADGLRLSILAIGILAVMEAYKFVHALYERRRTSSA